jgi:hypothetical protein
MQSNGGNMTIGNKVILSAAIGGTAEALGGGKPARRNDSGGGFSNGAVTGAYVMMFNHLMHITQDPPKKNGNNKKSATEVPAAVAASIQIISEGGQGIMNQSQAITKALSVETEVLETGLDFSKELGIIGKYGKFLKCAGYVGSAVSFADTEYQYQKEIITRSQANIEQASNVIGLIPVVGAAWSAGWWFGKNYGFSTW